MAKKSALDEVLGMLGGAISGASNFVTGGATSAPKQNIINRLTTNVPAPQVPQPQMNRAQIQNVMQRKFNVAPQQNFMDKVNYVFNPPQPRQGQVAPKVDFWTRLLTTLPQAPEPKKYISKIPEYHLNRFKTGNDFADMLVNLPQAFLETPNVVKSGLMGASNLGEDIYNRATPQQMLAHAAQAAELPLTIATLGGASTLFRTAGKQGIKQVLPRLMLEGGTYGAGYGTLGGLQANANAASVQEQLLKTLPYTALGTAAGVVTAPILYAGNKALSKYIANPIAKRLFYKYADAEYGLHPDEVRVAMNNNNVPAGFRQIAISAANAAEQQGKNVKFTIEGRQPNKLGKVLNKTAVVDKGRIELVDRPQYLQEGTPSTYEPYAIQPINPVMPETGLMPQVRMPQVPEFQVPQEFGAAPQYRSNQLWQPMPEGDKLSAQAAIDYLKTAETLDDFLAPEYTQAENMVRNLGRDYLGAEFVDNPQTKVTDIMGALEDRVQFDSQPQIQTRPASVSSPKTITPEGVAQQAAISPEFRATGTPPAEGFNISKEQAREELSRIFNENEIGFLTKDAGEIITPDGQLATGKYFNSIIEVVESGGKVNNKDVYHEAFHAYVDKFANQNTFKAALEETKTMHNLDDKQANEQMAEDFASWLSGKTGFGARVIAFFENLLNQIKGLVGKKNQAQQLFNDILTGQRPETIGGQLVPEGAFRGPNGRVRIQAETAGMQGVESAFATIDQNGVGHLNIQIAPEGQGLGQGTELVAQLENKLNEAGVKQVNIDSFVEAVGFWKKMGYDITDISQDRGLVQMSKVLDAGASPQFRTENLPADLKGAKPRYSYGAKQYQLNFASDVDKAFYIVAQKNPSSADSRYMQFLTDNFPGLSENNIREIGQRIRNEIIKPQAAMGEGGAIDIPTSFTDLVPQTKNINAGQTEIHATAQEIAQADPELAQAIMSDETRPLDAQTSMPIGDQSPMPVPGTKEVAPQEMVDEIINNMHLDPEGAKAFYDGLSTSFELPPFEDLAQANASQLEAHAQGVVEAAQHSVAASQAVAQYANIIRRAVRTYNLHKANGRYDMAKAELQTPGLNEAIEAIREAGADIQTMDQLAQFAKGLPKAAKQKAVKTPAPAKVSAKTSTETPLVDDVSFDDIIAESVPADVRPTIEVPKTKKSGKQLGLGNIREKTVPKDTPLISAPSKISAWRKLLDSTVNAISTQGPAGQQLGRMIKETRTLKELTAGKWTLDMKPVWKLSKEEFENFIDVSEAKAKPMNDTVKTAFAAWDKVRNEIADLTSQKDGVDILVGKRENYYPHRYEDKSFEGKSYMDKVRHLIETKQATDELEAAALLQKLRQYSQNVIRDKRHGNLEYPREIDVPGFDRSKSALIDYLYKAADRYAQVKVLGKADVKAIKLIHEIGKSGGDQRAVQDLYDIAVGDKVYGDTSSAVSGALRRYQGVTKLGLSAISNATQSANTATVTGLINTLSKVPGALFNQADKDFALEMGATLDGTINDLREGAGFTGQVLNRINAPAFNPVEKFNRTVAANAGRQFAIGQAKKAASGDKGASEALTKMGLDAEAIIARGGKLTHDEELRAAINIVERTQFKVDPQDLPGWASSPLGKLVFQFRTFSYNQTKFMLREVFQPALHFNFGPLLTFIVMGGALGYGSNELRKFLTQSKYPSSAARTIFDSYSRVGTFGLPGDIASDIAKPQGYRSAADFALGVTGAFGGPTVDTGTKTLMAGYDLSQGKPKAAEKLALQQIPMVGNTIKNLAFPYGGTEDNPATSAMASTDLYTNIGEVLSDSQITNVEEKDLKDQKSALQKKRKEIDNNNGSDFLGFHWGGLTEEEKNTQMEEIDQQIDSIDKILGLTKLLNSKDDGLMGYKTQNDKYKKARELFKDETLPDNIKQEAFKTLGLNPAAVQYDVYATEDSDVIANFLYDSLKGKDHKEVLTSLESGRVQSLSGELMTKNAVLDKLVQKGLISYYEAKALKAIEYDQNGKEVGSLTKAPKKAKKVSMPKIKMPTPKMTKIKVNKPKISLKTTQSTYQSYKPTTRLNRTGSSIPKVAPVKFRASGVKI